jgi:hypothetical protein
MERCGYVFSFDCLLPFLNWFIFVLTLVTFVQLTLQAFHLENLADHPVYWVNAGFQGILWVGIIFCWAPTNIFKIDFLAGLSVHWGDAGQVVGWHIFMVGPNKYIQNRFFGRLVSALW